jgi:hypothetical protein
MPRGTPAVLRSDVPGTTDFDANAGDGVNKVGDEGNEGSAGNCRGQVKDR